MPNLSDKKFKDFIKLQRGFDLPKQDRVTGEYPVVASTSITDYHSEYRACPPGVTTGRSGALGEVLYITKPFWPLNTVLWVKDFKGNFPRYVYYYLKTLDLKRYNAGAGVPTLNRNHLDNLDVTIHDLPEQKKISSILSAYDDLIENNTRRIKILEEMAQAIYRHRFVDFKFPGHKKIKMIDSPLGKIPEGWEVKTLGDLVTTQYGYTESTQEAEIGPKFLRGMDINKSSYIDWSCVPYCPIDESDYEKFRLSEGDIVIIRMADPGKVGIVEKDVDAVFASYLVRLHIVSEKLAPYFLFYFLLSDRYQAYVTGASTGTTRKSVSAGVMTGIALVTPPKQIVEAFESQIGNLRQLLNKLLERNANLRRTRDLLLPKLISGEIQVEGTGIVAEEIATAMEVKKPVKTHKATDQFKDAILISALVRALSSKKYPLSRKRYQKNVYLVLRKAEYDVTHKFLKKAAGPYDHSMRYKGGEGIALRNCYIKRIGTWHFVAGDNISVIDKYLPRYDFANCLGWTFERFKYKTNDELELLTTVDYAMVELAAENKGVNADAVYNLIKSEPKWAPKLNRSLFSQANIRRAINELKQHFPETYDKRKQKNLKI